MKAYFCLAVGAVWIIVAVLFSRGGLMFGIHLSKGSINPASMISIFRLTPYLIVFGWMVPAALGLWLLRARK